jgi:23S rRNA (cytosine1962-C5)-methyltransferase
MGYKGLKFRAQLGGSRHVGVFPEQAVHWDWMAKLIRDRNRPTFVLNLFGYTGLATLAVAQAGASVTHVDASKKSVTRARENQVLSRLEDRPIRWIVDDVIKFVQREARRQVHYDGLILDPPKFGRGPKGEVWECFDMLPGLLQSCREILSDQPLFIVITAYAIRASALSLFYSLEEMMRGVKGTIEAGELVAEERSAGRKLSMAIYARWRGV